MKICPRCQTPNDDSAKFCEHCGYQFADEPTNKREEISTEHQEEPTENLSRSMEHQDKQPKSKLPLIIAGVALAAILLASGVYFFTQRDSASEGLKNTSTTTSSSSPQLAKYDKVIREAKELSIDGKYKESELKLASIPVSDLAKPEFASLQSAVEEITEKNNQGIQKEDAQQNSKNDSNNGGNNPGSNSGFTGDLAKWANTYTFYYAQSSQKQRTLSISANGGVTQSNYDGTQYFGTATITKSSGDILSYETNELYPSDMPDTKTIHPDVKITVNWENGSQVYYGYLSYSSRLALTDGVTKGAGVNEVWISY